MEDVDFLIDSPSPLAIERVGLLNLKKVLSPAFHLIAIMLSV